MVTSLCVQAMTPLSHEWLADALEMAGLTLDEAAPLTLVEAADHLTLRHSSGEERLDKPFTLNNLVNQLTHFTQATAHSLGSGVFDAAQRQVKGAEGTASLTEKESALLSVLLREPVAKREALLADIWGYEEGIATHTLESHIYRLRAKLAAAFGDAVTIDTTPDGYTVLA